MKRLQQEKYHDNDKDWQPIQISTLAPYQHISDGFYVWECGRCGHEHNCRICGWPIAGQVEFCKNRTCGVLNLLVSTNTDEINELRNRKWLEESQIKELERLRGIEQYNQAQVAQIKAQILDNLRRLLFDKI